MTTPLLRALRRFAPHSQIDVLVEPSFKRVLEGNPHLDRLLLYDKTRPVSMIRTIRFECYGCVIDCLSNPRSALLALASDAPLRAGFQIPFWSFAYNIPVSREMKPEYSALTKLRLLEQLASSLGYDGLKNEELSLDFYPTESEQNFVDEWLRTEGFPSDRALIILAPASRRATRRWIPSGWGVLARKLQDRLGAQVLGVWGPGEEDQRDAVLSSTGGDTVRVLPPTTIGQMAAFFERSSLVIAADNGAKNLAVALKVPTLTVYGPTQPAHWNPPDHERHRFIQTPGLACLGCGLNRCPYHHECMEWMDPEDVFTLARQQLEAHAGTFA